MASGMRKAFDIYAILAPLVLMPIAVLAWWRHYEGNAQLTALAVILPVLHAYIVPGIGTNVLGMWAFNARLKVGKFRPQHGFVFGSATALLTLLVIGSPDPHAGLREAFFAGCAGAALLLAVNWSYDALAIRHEVLEVYNQPWADGAGAWAIAGDYVVWFFGLFGLIYVGGLKLAEGVLLKAPTTGVALGIGAALLGATLLLPALCYIASSYLRHGHNGCRPVMPRDDGVRPPAHDMPTAVSCATSNVGPNTGANKGANAERRIA